MSELTLASLYDTVHSLERVLEAFPMLIIATDTAGRIVMTSQRPRDALGLSEVDLLDRPVAAVVPGLAPTVTLPRGDGDPRVEIGAPLDPGDIEVPDGSEPGTRGAARPTRAPILPEADAGRS
ncbi:MAG: hypothetical protein RLO01_00985 [Thalassobaculaceae bacterium]